MKQSDRVGYDFTPACVLFFPLNWFNVIQVCLFDVLPEFRFSHQFHSQVRYTFKWINQTFLFMKIESVIWNSRFPNRIDRNTQIIDQTLFFRFSFFWSYDVSSSMRISHKSAKYCELAKSWSQWDWRINHSNK